MTLHSLCIIKIRPEEGYNKEMRDYLKQVRALNRDGIVM